MLMARILSAGLCSTLLLFSVLLLPAGPVSAQSINVTEGIVGSTVVISDLEDGKTYTITWDGTTYKSGTVPSTGIVTFEVPETYGGTHAIRVQNPSGTQVLTRNFTVLPSISITPDTGTVGKSITVSGTGFADSETKIKILYDSSSIKSGIEADDDGSWSASFDAPASEGGVHEIDASGSETSATEVEDVDFTIEPKITVSPTSCGNVGCSITVKGSGFAEKETSIKVRFDSTNIKTGITADSNGSWSATFDIPSTYSGTHSIDASGSSTDADDIDDVDFVVESGISIDKTSAHVGDTVVVTGTGFGKNENGIYITFDDAKQGSSIKADATGQWETPLTVPEAVNGPHTIDAYGGETSAGSVDDKSLTILAQITISPASGNVGDSISISGTGFTGGKTVVVTFGAVSVLDNISSDSSGSFTGRFNAPKGASGEIKVVAKDAKNVSATSVFAMETTAPPVPQIKSPASGKTVGFVGKTRVDFAWTEVTDPSGVSYDIQVATDVDFKNIVFEHSGLTVAEYKSADTESLAQGQYYWRVRAVDDAGNTSDWTTTTEFKAGRMSLTTTIIIVLVVVVIILIAFRARSISSKKS